MRPGHPSNKFQVALACSVAGPLSSIFTDIATMTTHTNGSNKNRLEDQVAYDPNHLLDSLIEKLSLKNDAALSRALEVAPPVISKIRHRRLPVGASLLIRMHEVSDLSIRDLRILMGDRREKFRISDKQFKPKEDVGASAGGSSAAPH